MADLYLKALSVPLPTFIDSHKAHCTGKSPPDISCFEQLTITYFILFF